MSEQERMDQAAWEALHWREQVKILKAQMVPLTPEEVKELEEYTANVLRIAGILTPEEAARLREEVREMREEWD